VGCWSAAGYNETEGSSLMGRSVGWRQVGLVLMLGELKENRLT
jgi:hypothetical protein